MVSRVPTVLFLGAAPFQVPPIRYARERGYRVVTCDNRPGNPGHRLAHASHEASTVDAAAVLRVAERERVDAVLAYGSDVSALSAALVAERLGLPGNPPEAVERLTDKARFRAFLSESGLQPHEHAVFERAGRSAARDLLRAAPAAMVVKPVDTSGSKGVQVLHPGDEVDVALDRAYAAARSGRILVERFVARRGRQVCGDGYLRDGRIEMVDFGDGWFHDERAFPAPFAETFPSAHEGEALVRARELLERVLSAAGMRQGPFNLDVIVTPEGAPFVIEVGPRAGGNFLPSAISVRTGVDLVAAAVECALDPTHRLDAPSRDDRVASYMVHARAPMRFGGLAIDPAVEALVVESTSYLQLEEPVRPFHDASAAVANLILRFPEDASMHGTVAEMEGFVHIVPGADAGVA